MDILMILIVLLGVIIVPIWVIMVLIYEVYTLYPFTYKDIQKDNNLLTRQENCDYSLLGNINK